MEKLILKKTDTLAKANNNAPGTAASGAVTSTTPASKTTESEDKKPVLLGQTRSIKIVDLQVRKRRRNPANCKYCNLPIEERYALSKGSRTGARYYHIKCAIKVGFDITV
ncbi:MAG TPA: hypothetical protein VFF30_06350 [Nitrososphaerales archaeon]|nr:hypothetical protein [Nitrososphaerales archaeon]